MGRIAAVITLIVALLGISSGTAGQSATWAVTFSPVHGMAGLTFRHTNGASAAKHFEEIMGSGGLFVDVDDDGFVDVFLVDGGSVAEPAVARRARHRLFRNRGDGTFADITATSGIDHAGYGMGACAGDYDNDGRVDLYVTNAAADSLFRNSGSGRFVDVTRKAGIAEPGWSTSCAFADFERDGDLDLFVVGYVDVGKDRSRFCGTPPVRVYCHPLNYTSIRNTVYRNLGNGTFADATKDAGIAGHLGNGLGVAIADYDDDELPDVFVANDSVPNFLFHNDGGFRFSERAVQAGVAVASDGTARAGMGTAFGDVDADGLLDLVVTNHETEMHNLFRNLGKGLFADATIDSGIGRATLPYVGFGVVLADVDNDADLDVAEVNGHVMDNIAQVRSGGRYAQPRLLLQNTGNRRFRDVSRQSGPGFAGESVGRGLAAADIDNDGDLDLLITSNGGPAELLRNDGGNRGNALIVRLVGVKTNRDAIGARVTLTAGTSSQTREVTSGASYLSQSDMRLHFGLGAAAAANLLEVRWPDGAIERLSNVPVNRVITIRQGQGITAQRPFAR